MQVKQRPGPVARRTGGPGRCAPDRQRPTDGARSTVASSRGPPHARPAAAGRCELDRRPRAAARRTGGRGARCTGYCRHEQHRVNLLPHIDPAREGRMGGRGTQGRVRGIGGGGEGASFSLPHSFRQVQLWTFRRMHGPRSASRNTRGRTAVAVRAVRCARRAHLNAGAPAFEKHANRCIRKACHFAKHAIIEEWMHEGKFNGYLTESKA